MKNNAIAQEFADLADKELKACLALIPEDRISCHVLLVECLRIMDYFSIFNSKFEDGTTLSESDRMLLYWGCNMAIAHLFRDLHGFEGVPLMKSTQESKKFAISMLHDFGKSVLLSRIADMINAELVNIELNENGCAVRMKNTVVSGRFIDAIHEFELSKLWNKIENSTQTIVNGWELKSITEICQLNDTPGNYFLKDQEAKFEKWLLADIESLMLPLIQPWDSGNGIMMGYETTPEIDDHFFAIAFRLTMQWRQEAGIHPSVNLGEFSGADLTMVTAYLISFRLKCIEFAKLAAKNFPEIVLHQSLTIWKPKSNLIESIASHAHMEKSKIRKILEAISIRAADVPKIDCHSQPFMPLLLDLGNEYYLEPVFGVTMNPFISVRMIQEWRNSESRNAFSIPREGWMRSELYAAFSGIRYVCVEGNVVIRKDSQMLTDIDAAIFDRLTGELALFQLKWQDYSTNSLREIRSKASNLIKELDTWAGKMNNWLSEVSEGELRQILRFRAADRVQITNTYLFGVSRTLATTQYLGFASQVPNLAISTWAQFSKQRFEVGPAERVFFHIHTKLRQPPEKAMKLRPMPVVIQSAGKSIRLEDIWQFVE